MLARPSTGQVAAHAGRAPNRFNSRLLVRSIGGPRGTESPDVTDGLTQPELPFSAPPGYPLICALFQHGPQPVLTAV
jgi:hypothetical protein